MPQTSTAISSDATSDGEKQRLQFGPPIPVAQPAGSQPQQPSSGLEPTTHQHVSSQASATPDQTTSNRNNQESDSHLSTFARNNPEGIRVSTQLMLFRCSL